MELVLILFLTILLLIVPNHESIFAYGQKDGNQSDFVFNVAGVKKSPVIKDFQIKGDVWDQICPSNQCQIETHEQYLFVGTPNLDDIVPRVFSMMWFYLHDNVTNKSSTQLQKNVVEIYRLYFSCGVNDPSDIVEQGNNLVYKCSGNSTFLGKDTENAEEYYFAVEGTYDNQTDTLSAAGKYDRKL